MIALALVMTLSTPNVEAILTQDVVEAIITVESNWDSRALSPSGAMGLMQIMPGTWKEFGEGNPFDPASNMKCGINYMVWLLYQPAVDFDLPRALAAYNWGIGNLTRLRTVYPQEWRDHLPPETKKYLEKIEKELRD